ncbi:hypothetical protein QBC34DRAFT_377269, partial [Podospora aff. communis PSN243]
MLTSAAGFISVDTTEDPNDFVETDSLAHIIGGLPAGLEKLVIRDWWHEYRHPAKLLPIRARAGTRDEPSEPHEGYEQDNDCLERLKTIQQATLAALTTLAPLLKKHSKVKKVDFVAFEWRTKDARHLMRDLLSTRTGGVLKIKIVLRP